MQSFVLTKHRRHAGLPRRSDPQGQRPAAEFCRLATQPPTGIVREFIDFLLQNKKWWLIPIVMAMFLVALMITVGSSGAGPFIYCLY